MEHEVFVPVPAETLRQTLRDPARVARCIPGLQRDADDSAGPLAGRFKVRVGGHTITYRGAFHITEQDGGGGGVFAVEGEGAEARGTGSVKLTLMIRPQPTDGGTTMTFTASARAEGRLADLAAGMKVSAAHRLLDRFAEALSAAAFEDPESARGAEGAAEPAAESSDADAAAHPGSSRADESGDASDETGGSVFDTPVPPPSLRPDADDEFDDLDDVDDVNAVDGIESIDDLTALPDAVPAEAAHARRTMIGRSAEEVDHAPPRGRYAPTPAPDAGSAGATLRWLAPAAALALASAVVVGRALRRRR
ncbi:SRPBCC domain-containing protein [Streptomyces sp. NPDC006283]|uniref:CoxG family protein n=1 Tax=Streptomyces sp. NPDC006283 TaxID=3156741 RepID=UPI0033AE5F20